MSSQPPVTPPATPNPAPNPNPQGRTPPNRKTPPDTKEQKIRSAAFWIIIVALLILWLAGWRWSNCGPWIHALPILALVSLLVELLTGNSKNIDAEEEHIPNWDPARPEASLIEIYIYVLDEAAKSTNWYWRNKASKATLSRIIRFVVWALAAVGGLLPIIAVLLQDYSNVDLTNGLWASLLLGVAAALLGLDKGFGFSSGWARYVLTATNIRKSLEEFRLDWAVLRAKAGNSLTAESVAPLIERAKQFRSEVEGLVLQETKDWVTEFQSTMAQMEKDVAAQLSTLKAQVDKTIKEREAATQPGYVQVTIKDPANKFAKASLKATLFDSNNQPVAIAKDLPVTSLTWSSPFVPPGFYHVKLEGTVDSAPFDQTRDATVKSGEKATPSAPDITL
ncbi:MAG: DUF5670 family protein [Candidatus Angelobacter sp.]